MQVLINGPVTTFARTLIQGEHNATVIIFSLPTEHDGVDLSGLAWEVKCVNVDADAFNITNLVAEEVDGRITLPWTVGEEYTGKDGTLCVTLTGRRNQQVRAKFIMNGLAVKKDCDGVSLGQPDYFEGIIEKTQENAERAETAANEAREDAGAAMAAAREAREQADSASSSAAGAHADAAMAQAIKDSTEVFYNVAGDQVGFRRANEDDFTYTSHLTGPKGDQGAPGPKGDRGESGFSVGADSLFTLHINDDGNLIVTYEDGAMPPNLHIDEAGHLIYSPTNEEANNG